MSQYDVFVKMVEQLILHNIIYECEKQMKTMTLEVPENIKLSESEIKFYLAAKMYQDGILSSGQAAEMIGISKRSFIERLGQYDVSVFSESVEDLINDINNA